ncbi:hypothetical protein [Xanthocytophaga flava]|uniref:hypothetical protein n=1 Tax=Xanthocytophaga flava TaxID=3048013 RepID=UPI0028D7AD73|nr:hypothetical protein [Xanthocytophaga flavus]MDJ1471083.1 hypothetical protein [Xanthocytophaga flavus]
MRVVVIAIVSLFACTHSFAQLGGALKKAKDKATSEATSIDGKGVQPDACISNVEGRLKSVNETYYPKFQKDAKGYLGSPSALWFARKDFEAARYFYTGGKQGYGRPGAVTCDQGPATIDPRYKALKDKMDAAEAKVKEMEKAKGYEFIGVKDNNILYKDIKTGKELSADESGNI